MESEKMFKGAGQVHAEGSFGKRETPPPAEVIGAEERALLTELIVEKAQEGMLGARTLSPERNSLLADLQSRFPATADMIRNELVAQDADTASRKASESAGEKSA